MLVDIDSDSGRTALMLLGELEQLITLAILRLGSEATARDIRALLKRETGQDFSRGSVYAALQRLTDKGLIEWETEDTSPDRGGIPRRLFTVTPAGLDAVREARRMVTRLSRGLQGVLTDR